jgi:hypothetical protein
MGWKNVVRYMLIAVAALVTGIAINLAMGNGSGEQNLFNPSLYLLLAEYGIFHVVALSVARILSVTFSVRIRSILYLSLSIIGFLASIYLLNPGKYGGVHLFIICWGSLALIALDYISRADGWPQHE